MGDEETVRELMADAAVLRLHSAIPLTDNLLAEICDKAFPPEEYSVPFFMEVRGCVKEPDNGAIRRYRITAEMILDGNPAGTYACTAIVNEAKGRLVTLIDDGFIDKPVFEAA